MDSLASNLPPVAVDGATGYVGSHVVWRLRKEGRPVRCIVRPQARQMDIDFLRSTGAQIISGELDQTSGPISEAFAGAAAAVHLIGSIAPRRGEKLAELHAGQTARIIEHCRKNGLKLVLVTALGAQAQAASEYHRTKWAAEEAVRNSGVAYVILRPSLLIGRQVGCRDSKLVRRYRELIETRKVIPLVAGGPGLVQPLFVGDLADAIATVIESTHWDGQTLELGGNEKLSMREFVAKLQDAMQVHKPMVALPETVARAAAFLSQTFQPVPLLSQDQVTLSLQDNVCTKNAVMDLLKRQPVSVADALNSYRTEAPSVVSTVVK